MLGTSGARNGDQSREMVLCTRNQKPKRLLTGTAGFAGIQIQIGREHSFGGRSHSACSKESTKKMAPSTNDCLEGPNDPLLSGDFVWPILPG